MAISKGRSGALSGIFTLLAASGCLDPNPGFNPSRPTTSDSASDSGGETTTTTATTTATTPTTTAIPPTSATSGEPTTGLDTTTAVGSTSTVGSSTGVQAVCGDGIQEGDEECDEGPANDDAGACTTSCTVATCGDGHVYSGVEVCDVGDGPPSPDCIDCLLPRTCKEIRDAVPGAGSDVYLIDLDGLGPMPSMPVRCDMDTEGGGWTLVERSPKNDPIALALFEDFPVNVNNPLDPRFRLPRPVMDAISGLATDMRIGCGGGDHLLLAADSFKIGEGDPAGCALAKPIMYKKAVVKGQVVEGKPLCTGLKGKLNECSGVWRIVEGFQMECGLLDEYPWGGDIGVASSGAELFAVDMNIEDFGNLDYPMIHDCHQPGAVRTVMMR